MNIELNCNYEYLNQLFLFFLIITFNDNYDYIKMDFDIVVSDKQENRKKRNDLFLVDYTSFIVSALSFCFISVFVYNLYYFR